MFVKKDIKYQVNDEQFDFNDLMDYIKTNSGTGFSFEKIEKQLIKEWVTKKLIIKALRKIK